MAEDNVTEDAAPLRGRTVVVTRPAHQAAELVELLEAHGARVLRIPAVEIQPPSSFEGLDEAIRNFGSYQWLIFTSTNGVDSFFARARDLRVEGFEVDLSKLQVCVIGPATKSAAEAAGLQVHLMPEEYVAESLVESFATIPLAGKRMLLPRAAVARDLAPEALRGRGAIVDVVEAYRSGVPADSEAEIHRLLSCRATVDWVTFTSSSTVKNFLAMGGGALLDHARIATIGPVTSDTVRKHGRKVDVEANEYTVPGLVDVLLRATR